MDYEKALLEHMGWHSDLSSYVKKPDGSLRAEELRVDDTCGLGRWIKKDDVKFRGLPEFSTLRDAHAKLHAATADLVRLADSGAPATAPLDSKGEFTMSLVRFIRALEDMKQRIS